MQVMGCLVNVCIKELMKMASFLNSCHFLWLYRSSHPEVFLEKGVLKICCNFTGEHSCRSVISIKLLSNFKFKRYMKLLINTKPIPF